MGLLSGTDVAFLKRLREEGVLEDVEPGKMDLSQGAIVVPCADGDQMDDLYSHLRNICKGSLDEARIHLLALNGGALLLSEDWPTKAGGGVLCENILGAKKLKKMSTVILMSHAPCGMAGMYGKDIFKVLCHLANAKRVVKALDPEFKVPCFFHIDWHCEIEDGRHKRRTYVFSVERWEEAMHWLKTEGASTLFRTW